MSDIQRLPEPPAESGSSPSDRSASPNGRASQPPASSPRRNRGWIWYFVILTLLAIGATSILVVYNLSQQLTREQFEKARKLWEEKGPKNYELRYTTRYGEDERLDHYVVVVRGGEVQSVTVNNTIRLKQEQFHEYGMTALFNNIEDFLDRDSKPGQPKVFKVARFSSTDGHLMHYVRRVMGGRERLEITVEEFKSE
jgi:hypothetical protein